MMRKANSKALRNILITIIAIIVVSLLIFWVKRRIELSHAWFTYSQSGQYFLMNGLGHRKIIPSEIGFWDPNTNGSLQKNDVPVGRLRDFLTQHMWSKYDWSSNGQLAVLAGTGFVVFDENGQQIEKKLFPKFTFSIDKFSWINENQIVMYGSVLNTQNIHEAFYIYDITSNTASRLCEGEIGTFHEGVMLKNDRTNKVLCGSTEGFDLLFGSREWPVDHLLSSYDPKGRYYFYQRWQESIYVPAVYWIEGYDRLRHKTFMVKWLGFNGID